MTWMINENGYCSHELVPHQTIITVGAVLFAELYYKLWVNHHETSSQSWNPIRGDHKEIPLLTILEYNSLRKGLKGMEPVLRVLVWPKTAECTQCWLPINFAL